MSVGGGANPAQETPDSAANWGPLSDWASATRLDWMTGWVQQVTSVATQFLNFESAIEQISEAADADLGQLLLSAFTGIKGILMTMFPWFQNLQDMLGGLDFTADDFDPIEAVTQFFETMVNPLGLLGAGLDFLGNLLPPGLIPLLPISSLGDIHPNLLLNGGFDTDAAIKDNPDWEWGATEGHGTGPLGYAFTIANGVEKVLISNDIHVTANQQIEIGAWWRWAGLVYTGVHPLRIDVVTYSGDVEGTTTTVAEFGAPGAASPGMDWQEISATYTVPDTGDIDVITVNLVVDALVTAGTVKVDDASARKQGLIPQDFVNGLTGALQAAADALQQLIDDLLNVPGNILGDLPDTIVSGVRSLLDNIFGGINRTSSTGHSHNEVLDSITSQSEALVGTAASLSQLAAAFGDGNPDADDFERTSLGSNWRVITSNGGSVTCNGHDLVMSHGDPTDYILLKTDELAVGDYQTCEITLGSAPGWGSILVDTARASNDIWLRCSNFTTWATRTGIRLRWTAENKMIRCSAWVNGAEVAVLYNAAVVNAVAGSRLLLETGVLGTPRRFTIRVNGGIIPSGDFVETGTASQFGALYRHRGCGGRTDEVGIDPLSSSPDPGTLKVWTATG